MLSHAKLPNCFWAEALIHAMHILNLSLSVPLAGDIPQRVWSGKYVSYKNLKVIGCKTFVHIPRDERAKLDSKKKQCIYLNSPTMSLDTDCGIHSRRRLWAAKMWCSLKMKL